MKILKISLVIYIFCFSYAYLYAANDIISRKLLITLDSNFNYKQLLYYGFDVETASFKGNKCEIIVDDYEFKLLKSINVHFRILDNHFENNYHKRFLKWKKENSQKDILLDADFKFGSMGGYFTLEEIYKEFNQLRKDYPQFLVSIDTIGFTFENRPIILYTIGDTSKTNNEVLITALHHAREPGGASVVIYFAKNLLRRAKENDAEASFLLKNRILYIIPVVNPDGYYFNEVSKPEGGGMWRKNRAMINDTIYGVDLNRNYGPYEFWNAPVNGSSDNPKNATFRGSGPFSEKETQAIRDFVLSKNIKLALNYHTYNNLLLYPYSALLKDTPDSAYFRILAREFSRINRYVIGRDVQTINYVGRGVSDDWYYWTSAEKPVKTFAITPEVGTIADNFWATPDRIPVQCRENLYMNYQLLWSADVNWRPQSLELTEFNGKNSFLINVINTGVTNTKTKPVVTLKSLVSGVDISPMPSFDTLNNRRYMANFEFSKSSNIKNGDSIPVQIKITQNNVNRYDTMSVYIWKEDTIKLFVDEKLFGQWNKDNWDGEYSADKGHFVLSDSPNAYYPNNDTNSLSLQTAIELNFNAAYLQFNSFWQIETNFDYGVVEISTDNGNSWEKLDTKQMKRGSGARLATIRLSETGFTGYSFSWLRNKISLNKYLGKKINLRFSLMSDAATNNEGWLLDSIMIITFPDIQTSVATNNTGDNKIFPNPGFKNSEIRIPISETEKVKEIKIYNNLGEEVSGDITLRADYISIKINNSGTFYIHIKFKNGKSEMRKLILF